MSRPRQNSVARISTSHNGQSGQALLTAALALVVLLLAAGLAVDMGYLRYQKRRMQSAADSAALAGAAELAFSAGAITVAVQNAAQADAKADGFDSSNPAVSVIAQKPTSGAFTGQDGYVEVLIHQNQPTFFMKIFRVNSIAVSARAVAHLGSSQNSLYALGQSPNALTVNGAPVLARQSGFISNGDFTATGGANVQALSIGVVGTSNVSGATVAPDPKRSVPAADPLASLPPPPSATNTPATCQSFDETKTAPAALTWYCGIAISKQRVIFPSGTYLIAGDFTLSGNGSIQGVGVTFFITRDPSGKAGAGAVNFAASLGTDLQAPRLRGPYEGILMIRDPTDPGPPPSFFLAGTSQELDGAIYFPNAAVTLGPNTNAYSILVARDITLLGSGAATINLGPAENTTYSDYLPDGSPIKGASLVE